MTIKNSFPFIWAMGWKVQTKPSSLLLKCFSREKPKLPLLDLHQQLKVRLGVVCSLLGRQVKEGKLQWWPQQHCTDSICATLYTVSNFQHVSCSRVMAKALLLRTWSVCLNVADGFLCFHSENYPGRINVIDGKKGGWKDEGRHIQ